MTFGAAGREGTPFLSINDTRVQVTLSQYRPSASDRGRFEDPTDGAGAEGVAGGGISRSLLMDTNKEVVFDGLKKLYRKKVT